MYLSEIPELWAVFYEAVLDVTFHCLQDVHKTFCKAITITLHLKEKRGLLSQKDSSAYQNI